MTQAPESLKHTPGHRRCPACEAAKSFALRKLSMSALGLAEAGELWLSGKHWKRSAATRAQQGQSCASLAIGNWI
jgi:hypothetical protein